jgi:hypothetical protein
LHSITAVHPTGNLCDCEDPKAAYSIKMLLTLLSVRRRTSEIDT